MFFILLFFILLVVIVWNSKLQIKIYNLDVSTARTEIIKRDFDIYLGIVVFNKIEILKINIKKIKNKKINIGIVLERVKRFQERGNKEALLKDVIKSLLHYKVEVKELNLNVEVGTEDVALTAILVGIISTILGIMLKKQKFAILPIYKDKNILNIKLNCIFRINLIHYIYKMILKGRDENERKSSNRRTYAYSYE